MSEQRFNIRVYGILINSKDELLVSDEVIRGLRFTKFPGGGLEWGEGTRECLQREFMEELNQEIEVEDHYYTTDYFQVSAFKATDQLMSIYYKVRLVGPQNFETKSIAFDFPDQTGNPNEVQRWIALDELDPSSFKWPVDQIVATMLKSDFINEAG